MPAIAKLQFYDGLCLDDMVVGAISIGAWSRITFWSYPPLTMTMTMTMTIRPLAPWGWWLFPFTMGVKDLVATNFPAYASD